MKGVAVLSICFLLLLVPVGVVSAMPGTTTGGYPACLSEEWWDDMVKFAAADDKASFERYFQMNRCVALKAGLRVTVTKPPGMFGGRTEFVFQGVKLWGPRESISYGEPR